MVCSGAALASACGVVADAEIGASVAPNEVATVAAVEDLAWAATWLLKPVGGLSGVGVPGTETDAAANVASAVAVSSGGGVCETAAGVHGATGVAVVVGFAVPAVGLVAVSPFGTPAGVVAETCVCAACACAACAWAAWAAIAAVVDVLAAMPAAAIASGVALVAAGGATSPVTGVGVTMIAAAAAAIRVMAGVPPSGVAICGLAAEASSPLAAV